MDQYEEFKKHYIAAKVDLSLILGLDEAKRNESICSLYGLKDK